MLYLIPAFKVLGFVCRNFGNGLSNKFPPHRLMRTVRFMTGCRDGRRMDGRDETADGAVEMER